MPSMLDAAEKKLIKYGRKMDWMQYNLNALANARVKEPAIVKDNLEMVNQAKADSAVKAKNEHEKKRALDAAEQAEKDKTEKEAEKQAKDAKGF